MTESHLDELQRKVQVTIRRNALCYLAAQMLGDPERPSETTLIVNSFPYGGHFDWSELRYEYRADAATKFGLRGRLRVEHIVNPEVASRDGWSKPMHFVLHAGAIPGVEDLYEQETLLERAMLMIQEELDRIRADLHAGVTYPKVNADPKFLKPYR